MKKKKFEPGTIISIPCDSYYVVAKILYISDYFRNITLLKIYSHRIPLEKSYSEILNTGSFELIYTSTNLIKKGKWNVLERIPLSSADKEYQKRIVGGDVWDGDNCLGPASDHELNILKNMDVFNVNSVEKKVSKYLPV